jgi:hypothetical protein
VRVNSKSLKGGDYILDDGSEDMIWDYMILDEVRRGISSVSVIGSY